ncbi:MAG TPA: tannase/feruloyl esterase family alpha/beta hydrolase [Burkholderiaceae bacterium]|nr:tannase/feruloyl esterase family alpha/beta hydrolase [Burkholderiaceae bacterium]
MNVRATCIASASRAAFLATGLAASVVLPRAASAAMPNCTTDALNGAGVAGVSIASAVDVPASPPTPEFCDVRGALVTQGDGAPDGSAQFELQLPVNWNQKFLFWGVGGTAGSTYADFAANPVDYVESLAKGYATAITDEGHEAPNTAGSWALASPGVADAAALTDYYFRATHQVTVAAKELVSAFYGASKIAYAYFDGCSNGGRQAMVEATQYPDDYDGIIAGAPFFDIRAIVAGDKFQKVQLRSPQAYLPASLLPMIDQAVYAACDEADGVRDGLIQNPARCNFDPASLICAAGSSSNCLTPDQANTLRAYISALRNERGELVYTGASITDLAGGADVWSIGAVPPSNLTANEPWGGTGFSPAPVSWQFVDHILKFIVARDPDYDIRNFPVSIHGVVGDRALEFFDSRTRAGNGDDPRRLKRFLERQGKLIMFHGFSDPALPPFRTVHYYEQLAREYGGYERLHGGVRLFMVPGMQHCAGGPGPNLFDTLTALEVWVEAGKAPDGIIAAHYVNNDTTQPIDRTMPLCKFPEEAQYAGSGDYANGANWSCSANRKLLEVGSDGAQAGL